MHSNMAQYVPDNMTIRDFVRFADMDHDDASFEWIAAEDSKPHDPHHIPERIVGAIVTIKGQDNVLALARWLQERGLITPAVVK